MSTSIEQYIVQFAAQQGKLEAKIDSLITSTNEVKTDMKSLATRVDRLESVHDQSQGWKYGAGAIAGGIVSFLAFAIKAFVEWYKH